MGIGLKGWNSRYLRDFVLQETNIVTLMSESSPTVEKDEIIFTGKNPAFISREETGVGVLKFGKKKINSVYNRRNWFEIYHEAQSLGFLKPYFSGEAPIVEQLMVACLRNDSQIERGQPGPPTEHPVLVEGKRPRKKSL